ncbi:MAG: hypothetical protein AB7G75_27270 [Candidatus Binatia bacterium]
MAEFRFVPTCLTEISQIEAACLPREARLLDAALARTATNPNVASQFPSFYDPQKPSFLYRADPFMIHFRIGDDGVVEFLNVFWRRV